MCIVMIWYTCALWKNSSHLVNTHHHNCLTFFVCIWEYLSFTSVRKFQLYSIVLPTILTMLYRYSNLTHIIAESLYPLKQSDLIHPATPPILPTYALKTIFLFCCYEFVIFFLRSHIEVKLYSFYLSLSGLLHWI